LSSSSFFSLANQPFVKRPVVTIQDFDFHSDDHFEEILSFIYQGKGCTSPAGEILDVE